MHEKEYISHQNQESNIYIIAELLLIHGCG